MFLIRYFTLERKFSFDGMGFGGPVALSEPRTEQADQYIRCFVGQYKSMFTAV